jgi:hypothetical protein
LKTKPTHRRGFATARPLRRLVGALVWGGVALAASGCQSSCDKLAKAICARGVDPRICAEATALAQSADQAARARCRESRKGLDRYVREREMALKLRDMFERFEKSPPAAPLPAASAADAGKPGGPDAGAR